MRTAQQTLSDITARGSKDCVPPTQSPDVSAFLESLAVAWKDGEVRPTHRKQPTATRWWRTRADPFAEAWPVVEGWLLSEPTATAKDLMERLSRMVPDVYASKVQLRTLQRRIKEWRAEKAKDLILGQLRKSRAKELEPDELSTKRAEPSKANATRSKEEEKEELGKTTTSHG